MTWIVWTLLVLTACTWAARKCKRETGSYKAAAQGAVHTLVWILILTAAFVAAVLTT